MTSSSAAGSTRPAPGATSTSTSTSTSLKGGKLHRRLNILIYFNKDWKPDWGGNIELWDADVKKCHHSFSPVFNRCVVFETNEISYHGVTAVKCPEGMSRKSFAAYYYTKEAPKHWTGVSHSTIFKARPDEVLKGNVMMPLENAKRRLHGVPVGLQEEDQRLKQKRSSPRWIEVELGGTGARGRSSGA